MLINNVGLWLIVSIYVEFIKDMILVEMKLEYTAMKAEFLCNSAVFVLFRMLDVWMIRN